MSYNIGAFVKYLGNPLDGSVRSNVLYFKDGRQRFIHMETPADINRAEVFIAKNDGRHQIYINVNPYNNRVIGKGRDTDVPEIKNLYVDIDAIKNAFFKKSPATNAEINAIPLIEIREAMWAKYPDAREEFTGNGYRFIIPVQGASPVDEVNLVCYMHNLFPEYVDRSVRDPSRITGVPGTLNVKNEKAERPSRYRAAFDETTERVEVPVATYTPEELPPIMRTATPTPTVNRDPRTYTKINPDDDMKEPLNKYILNLSKNAPHILLLLATPPVGTHGFALEQFFAAEIVNKIGNAPKVFVAICMKIFGSDYDPAATKTAWFRTIQEGVGCWSTATFTKTFGDYGQKS